VRTPPIKTANRSKTEIGWREFVGLPDLGIAALRAKIDTGARTSALHAVDLEFFDHEASPQIEFHVPLPGQPRWKRCRAPVVDHRLIKNTSGVPENRYVVETTLVLGDRHWRIEVSLADREKMEFDLLLGRTAIRNRGLLINPSRSFLAGAPAERQMKDHAPLESGLSRTLERGRPDGDPAALPGEKR
jgi:hypothetical protein